MPRSFVDMPLSQSAGHMMIGRLSLGMVWGGFSGAIIGVGISMTIGLFYSSATALIFTVIAISGMLGAVFGQIMASLLADDAALTKPAAGSHQALYDTFSGPELSDHKALKIEQQTKFIPNQDVMAKINTMRSGGTTLPPYRPNAQVFELIVTAAHKTEASGHGKGLKSLS